MKGLMIAGAASGVGKTTVTLALIAAMRRRGLIVQPFKGGPDFLDTGHHSRIAGRKSRNLDTWMLSREANVEVFQQAVRGADVAVVEGMMGLFDGKDGATEIGSSAEIAKLLGLPVVLVLDASKSARSIAAVVLGFEMFDPDLRLAGVVLNRVASERHYRMLEAAIQSSCRTPLLGWLPREAAMTIPERHLGLHAAEESEETDVTEKQLDALAAFAETHLELDKLMALDCAVGLHHATATRVRADANLIRIGVARDRAFSFYYEDNLELLRSHGAELVSFSPLADDALPADLDALYLGGGYPELYAQQLSANRPMLECVRAFAGAGRPIYAECGGMIYLSEQIQGLSGQAFAMAAVLPMGFEMTNRLVQFGYVSLEFTCDCLLGAKGTQVRGHSFHYSKIVKQPSIETSYHVQYSLSGAEEEEGYRQGNILASYVHLHFRSAPMLAQSFVDTIRRVRAMELTCA